MVIGLLFHKGRGLQRAISVLLTFVFLVSPLLTAYAESPDEAVFSALEWNDLSSLGYQEHLQMLDSGRAMSSDGRFIVAYKIMVDQEMDAASFIPQDFTALSSLPFGTMLYLVDRKTGEVELVTQTVSGEANGMSNKPSISRDGRYVAYESDDTNLVEAGPTALPSIYLYDRDNKTTKRISKPENGEPNGPSMNAVISDDGKFVAFESAASNLVEGDVNEAHDIFLYHVENGQLDLISKSKEGSGILQTTEEEPIHVPDVPTDEPIQPEGEEVSGESSISDDVYRETQNMTPTTQSSPVDHPELPIEEGVVQPGGEVNGEPSISTKEDTEALDPISEPQAETDPVDIAPPDRGQDSKEPSISADGRYIVFSSYKSTFVEKDENEASDIFLFDRTTDEIQLISMGYNGEFPDADSQQPYISGNGQVIAFTSYASNLVEGIEVTDNQIYVYSREDQNTALISKTAQGVPANGYNQWPVVSLDGRYILFHSQSDNLNSSDINDFPDIYLYDLQQEKVEWITPPTADHKLSGSLGAATISEQGGSIIFSALSYMEIPGESEPMPYMGIFVRSRESDMPTWPENSRLTATKVQPDGIKLTWDPAYPEGLIGYQLFNGEQYLGFVDSSENSIILNHMEGGMKQTFQVMAVHETFNRKSGPELTYTEGDQQPPSWPQDKRLFQIEAVTPTQALLRWDAAVDNVGVDKYRILDKQNGNVLGETQDTRIQLEVQADKTYQIVLKAIDQAGQISSEGLELNFTSLAAAQDGSSLTAKVISGEAVELKWSNGSQSTPAAKYQIWRGQETGDLTLFHTVDGKLATYVDSTLVPLTGYRYEVKGIDAAGNEILHTNQVFIVTRATTDSKLVWEIARNKAKQVLPNEVLKMELTGEPGREVEAVIQFETWYDEQGQQLPEVRQSQRTIALAEDGQKPGTYKGNFPVDYGITQLISLEVRVRNANGQSHTIPAVGWPLKVAGDLRVELSTNVPDLIKQGQLHVWSSTERSGESISISGPGQYQVKGLEPAHDYTIRLFDESGKMMGDKHEVAVISGLESTSSFDLAVPAELSVQVNGLDTQPVKLSFTDKDSKAFLGESSSAQLGPQLSGVQFIGKRVGIKTHIGGLPFRQIPEQVVTLSPGRTEHTINLEPLPKGTLTGKVTDPSGEPVSGADVSISQRVDERDFTFTAKTNEQGEYSVEAMAGEAKVDVSYLERLPYAFTKDSSNTQIPGNLDLTVHSSGEGKITGSVYFKYLNSAWDGPFELDWSNAARLEYEVIHKGRKNTAGGFPVKVHGFAGDAVTVCAGGKTFPRVCKDLTLDADLNAHAEFRLEEKGGRVQGRVLTDGGQDTVTIQYRLYRMNDKEGLDLIDDFYGRSHLDLGIQVPGNYLLKIETGENYFAEKSFTLSEGEMKQLGDISLSNSGIFAGQTGNSFSATPNEQMAGGLVRLRAALVNKKFNDVNQVRLKLEIPKDSTLIEGSLQMDGNTIPDAGIEGSWIHVPIGPLMTWESRTVTYQIRLPQSIPLGKLSATGRVEFQYDGNDMEETLGAAVVETPGLSLEAPERLSVKKAVLSGRAPANEQVRVYEGQLLLGTATASPGGFWRMEVNLPDHGDPNMYVLHAEAGTGEGRLQTAETFVYYDSNQPKLMEMTLQQIPYGKKVTLDIEKGVARFPYVVTPDPEFEISLRFSDPQAVENVQVYLDGQDGDTVQAQQRIDGLYYAKVQTSSETLGGIYVDFDQKQPSLQDQWSKPTPAEEELRQTLPRGLRDFQVGEVDKLDPDNGKYHGSMDFTLPQYPGVKMSIRMEYDLETDYQPTTEEQHRAEESGLPFYSPTYELIEEDGKVKANMEWYVPLQLLQKNNEGMAANSSLLQYGKITAQYVGEKTGDAYTYNDMTGMPTNYLNYSKKINTIMDSAFDFDCPENMDGEFGKQFAKTMIYTVGGEVVKSAVSIAASYLSPTRFTGTFALNQGNNMFGSYIDRQVDNQISNFQQTKGSCEKETRRQKIRDARNKRLHPVWIYDPSGYVYEAVYSERVENAKATVIYQDPNTQEWLPWDADWFGQINPQYTDAAGVYGWDVPPGLWQVVVEKEGYETARSAELPVPPPHMDVRIGLLSYQPPQITQATAKTTAVEVQVSKPILVSEIDQDAIKVFANEEELVTGTVTATEVELSLGGVELTKKLRFEPEQPWLGGETITVEVDPGSVISYSGMPMLSSYRAQKVVELDTVPSSDANLRSLAVSIGSLNPAFSPEITEYSLAVPSGTTQIGIIGQRANPEASMTVNGEPAMDGEQKRMTIASNVQTILVVVTSASGEVKTYRLTVRREVPPPRPNDGGSNSSGGGSKPPALPKNLITENGQKLAMDTVRKEQMEKLVAKDAQLVWKSESVKEADGYRLNMDSKTWKWLNQESKAQTFKWETPLGILVLPVQTPENHGVNLEFVKGSTGWTVQLFKLDEQGKRTPITKLNSMMTLNFNHQGTAPIAVLRGKDPVPAYVTANQLKVYTSYFGNYVLVEQAATFKDIAGHWAQKDIQWMADRKFIRGLAENRFAPNGIVNRAQFVSFLARSLGMSGTPNTPARFKDVQAVDWFAADLASLIEAGIIRGYADGTFRPEQPISRQEMAVLMVQAAKYLGLPWQQGSVKSSSYMDEEQIRPWAREAVKEMTKYGLLQGNQGLFEPDKPATRAQTAVTLKNMLRQLGMAN